MCEESESGTATILGYTVLARDRLQNNLEAATEPIVYRFAGVLLTFSQHII
jgi:hypothetical protein